MSPSKPLSGRLEPEGALANRVNRKDQLTNPSTTHNNNENNDHQDSGAGELSTSTRTSVTTPHSTIIPSQTSTHDTTRSPRQRNNKSAQSRQQTLQQRGAKIMGNPYVKPSDQEKPKAKKKDKWRQTELPKPLDDNLHYGDTSLLLKSENSSRLYFLNVNSIKATNDIDHMSDICHQSAAAGIDFLLLAEVNINLREPNLRSTIKKHIDRVWENKMAWATATGKSASHTKTRTRYFNHAG